VERDRVHDVAGVHLDGRLVREGRVERVRRGVEEGRERAGRDRARRGVEQGAARQVLERGLVHVALSTRLSFSGRKAKHNTTHLGIAEVTSVRHTVGHETP
jgi:hypothetical protein